MAARKTKPKREKLPHGRPSLYTPELADEIVERISLGETLISIARDGHMPDRTTVWRWAEAHPDFSQRLRAARLAQADSEFDELREIADQPLPLRARETLEQRKQQIDVRKFRVARLNRALYGDKQDVNLGGQPENPLQAQVSSANWDALSPEEQASFREMSRKMLQGKQ